MLLFSVDAISTLLNTLFISTVLINNYNITLRREQQNSRSELNRERAFIARRENFLRQYDLDDAHGTLILLKRAIFETGV